MEGAPLIPSVCLSIIKNVALSVIGMLSQLPSYAILQVFVGEKRVELLAECDRRRGKIQSCPMVLVVSQCSLVFVSVGVLHSAENEVSLKNSHLCRCLSVSHSESPPPSRLKLPLVDLPAEDLPAVEVLESVSKLADVLGGVGEEHSVAVQQIVPPFPDVFDAVQVLLLHGLQVAVFSEVLLRNGSELVVEKSEMLVEGKIELLQSLLLDWLLALRLRLRLHCHSFLIGLLSSHDSRMQKLVVDTGNDK